MLTPTQTAFRPAWIKGSLHLRTGSLTPTQSLFWHPAHGTNPAEDVWVNYGFVGTGM
ncbi:hypothetical protein ACH4TP_10540 [Streptomyces sp. NPDC021012]|uniref:hypothetical protein n=1 Tax=Streptomyces sp. NPDC021012 TaxID=3365107 RepID=UPI0037B512E0